jgi:outer membrane protein assembly factor BamB
MPLTTMRRYIARIVHTTTIATALLAAPTFAADWPQYRGPRSDGHSDDAGVAKRFNAQPKLVWKAPMGEGFGTFAVAGDKAFIFVKHADRETLVCMNANTGKELWAQPLSNTIKDNGDERSNPRSTPAISGDKVYVYSVDMRLACFYAADGKPVWEHDIKKEFNGRDPGGWGNAISPIIDGDRLYVAGGGAGKAILCFNKNDGTLIWSGGNGVITHASPVVATIHGVKQVVCVMQQTVISVSAEDGKKLWDAPFKYSTSTASSPIVCTGKDEGLIYCSAGYNMGSALFKVEKSGDGFAAKELWYLNFEGPKGHNVNHWSTPVYHNGCIYGIFGFKDFAGGKGKGGGPARCLDLAKKQFTWTEPGFGSGGGTIFVDGYLLIQGDAGRLAMIEARPDRFVEKAEYTLPGKQFWSATIVANGKIYARSKTEAFCIDISK